MTLPGIAGIILSMGVAVDANILIFERFKEEVFSGKSMRVAMEAGFKRALSTITDANVSVIITAGILTVLGSGPVRGFAISLGSRCCCKYVYSDYCQPFLASPIN